MSLKIDEYLSYYGSVTELLKQQSSTENDLTQETTEKDGGSYVSTIGNSEDAIPCENYNDILQVTRKAKAESGTMEESGEETTDTETVSETGNAGGSGGNSDSEEETTTEMVVINGITYLETTTVTNGVTSVQRTQISVQNDDLTSILSDYSSIKNRSYGKLLEAYYAQQEEDESTSSESSESLALTKSSADELKVSAENLNQESLWEKKEITTTDSDTGEKTVSEDYDWNAISQAVEDFVKDYNSVIE